MAESPQTTGAGGSLLWVGIFTLLGVAVGLGCGVAAERIPGGADGRDPVFDISDEAKEELANIKSPNPPPPLAERVRLEGIEADFRNGMLAIGIAGAALCGLFGLLVGVHRKSAIGAIIGLLAGVVLGGAGGIAGGYLGKLAATKIAITDMDELYRAMLIHTGTWAPVGLAAGLTLGIAACSGRMMGKGAVVCLIVGAMAGAAFPFASMFLFPTGKSDRAIPQGYGNILFWVALAGGLLGLTVGRLQVATCKVPQPQNAEPDAESASS